jgi:hypothetical protein
MRAVILSSLFVFIGAIGACSATGGNNFTVGGTGGSGATGSGSGGSSLVGGFATAGSGTTGTGSGDACSAAAKLVYVLSTDDQIYSFEPDKKTFGNPFALNCNTPGNDGLQWAPNSMAVDRNAVAWVNYVGTGVDPVTLNPADQAGLVFKVDINKQTCDPTPAITLTDPSWYRLGMGFSADTSGGTSETLFVTGTGTNGLANSPGLGKVDMTTKKIIPVGSFTASSAVDLSGQSAELTGTGDGKLYGFFTTTPVYVSEITKTSGATPTPVAMNGVSTPIAWAFSFWGGDFYLYTESQNDQIAGITSSVTKYHPGGGVDPSYMTDIGFTIVGAGVSTCAPLTPPN